uniref:ribosomal protein S14 n=1 Tax=Zantedeschia aethiopica TaxID=69721 RepID=UPI002410ED12|nr:ribosomal protein S14 [Zantedeschia aethiopica]WEQ71685.1 ribosomal protein S14 [Zantedeschia aethiopica]
MSEKQNIRDHKRRLLAAKYELRRKLYKFVKIPIFRLICGTNIVISCPSCQDLCTSKKPMYFHRSPSFRS